jgi:hypothetical protein
MFLLMLSPLLFYVIMTKSLPFIPLKKHQTVDAYVIFAIRILIVDKFNEIFSDYKDGITLDDSELFELSFQLFNPDDRKNTVI